jgi:hypothetical protein
VALMPYSVYCKTAAEALEAAEEARAGGERVEIVRWYDKSLDPNFVPTPQGWVVGVDQGWGDDQSADAELEVSASQP